VKTFAAAAMTDTQTKTLKELLRSKFGEETWLALSAETQDALRERKRDALAAYLLTHLKPADPPSRKWENTNDLYAYYLLDVEMCSCQLTSRLVQGSGSVQLFVQRCFMGLEPDVVVKADGDDGDSAWRWWKWVRKYRVWEANRKVFLWPENWIHPELKKDRSSFFKDLENELMQNEVNQYTVETAFANYLEKLDGVAQLEIAGFYQEDDGDNTILHVFGRTKGAEPHLYYYRRYDYRQWTSWEKVDLDIQGDYLIPAVVNKRLFLFWPIFTEVPDEAMNSTIKMPALPGSTESSFTPDRTKKRLRLQMAVSDYRQGKWTPKRVSIDFDYNPQPHDVELNKTHYQFFAVDRTLTDDLFILKHRGHSVDNSGKIVDGSNLLLAALFGEFDISGCKGVPARRDVTYSEDFVHVIRPERPSTGGDKLAPGGGIMGYDTVSSKWLEDPERSDRPENDFTLVNQFSMGTSAPRTVDLPRLTPVLEQTPNLFTVAAPWHLSLFDRWLLDANVTSHVQVNGIGRLLGTWLPFFYTDKTRSFFVLPSLAGPRQNRNELKAEGTRLYYPEIKTSLRLWEAYFEGKVQSLLETIDFSSLTSAQRQQLELALHQQFHEVSPPPYTDEQVKTLLKRGLMRSAHLIVGGWALWWFQWRQFHFKNFYHPFVCDFAKLVYNPLKGIPALMSRETQLKNSGFKFLQTYQPTSAVVKLPPQYPSEPDCYPEEVVDFTPDGAYSPYNWEIFFHAPLLIANSLSKNQRFEEARDWYHFIFNPIGVESPIPGGSLMSKYWITKPFFLTTDSEYVQQRIDNILRMLAGDTSVPGYTAQAKKDLEDQVLDWRTNPFEPHRIANYRTVAYQKTVVMKYLDNLIAWGDNLFRQDSMESINEATQLYIMADEILGTRPKKVPPQAKPSLKSFNELEEEFDKFSNALVEVENLVPQAQGNATDGADPAPLPMLYFCIPQNDQMLGYWDTVADRLYKIRHCMNIEGVVRQLALFEPPIDPAALVKAVAGGMDISSALADLNAPLPLYRFNILLQKANEVCNDVKALGGALLAALEKKDAEALSLLRQDQEIKMLEAVKLVREKQIEEAKENLSGIKKNKELVTIRRDFYQNVEKISASEQLHQDKLGQALDAQQTSQAINIAASTAHIVPTFDLGIAGFGGSPKAAVMFGGPNVGAGLQAVAGGFTVWANVENYHANKASINASHDRRWDDWKLQEKVADKELEQIDKSIAAAELRIAIAEKELENHKLQIDNAKTTNDFMCSKYTNQELYQWQVGQISGVYFQSYRLAYDLAKRAERCYRFELGLQDSSYINFGYWDSLKKGLLAGEALQYDLRRLETAYIEQNRREFELTKHISLLLLDPLALVKLRETGRCFFQLREEIFDLDNPGHYFRRIKSVSLTLPCVTGPYTTITCTLRLLKNGIRINTANRENGYPHNTDDQGSPSDDDRFVENNIPIKAIAASNAQNDSGVFELNFRDERYLPFEGAGAISDWSLELFTDLPSNNPDPTKPDFGKPLRQFDYSTISDAILHIKYTAREDAGPFKNGAIAHLREYFSQDGATPSVRMLNLRHEFPNAWHRFLNPANPGNGNVFELKMSPSLFPFRDEGKTLKVNAVWLLARCKDGENYTAVLNPPLTPPPAGADTFKLIQVNQYGRLHFAQKDVSAASVTIDLADAPMIWQLKIANLNPTTANGNLESDPAEVDDVLLVIGYEWEGP
jgi:receptor-binding and translocation channel-forming TcA subunit of Tc toxin/ABC toxin-like protein/neuraminidase-like protein